MDTPVFNEALRIINHWMKNLPVSLQNQEHRRLAYQMTFEDYEKVKREMDGTYGEGRSHQWDGEVYIMGVRIVPTLPNRALDVAWGAPPASFNQEPG